jgi:hypothetical protein
VDVCGELSERHSQSMREFYASNLSNGAIQVTLQQLHHLIAKGGVIH